MTHAGIHSIDHFALHVPDLVEGRRFFEAFGLRVAAEAGGLALRASAGDHCWGRLIAGTGRKLAWLALSCHGEHRAALEACVRAHGPLAEPHPAAPQDGLWFHDPDGNLIRLAAGPKTTPSAPAGGAAGLPQGPGGRRIANHSTTTAKP